MMTAPGEFGLVSRTLGRLPIMNVMVERLGLPELLVGALPGEDARLRAGAGGRDPAGEV